MDLLGKSINKKLLLFLFECLILLGSCNNGIKVETFNEITIPHCDDTLSMSEDFIESVDTVELSLDDEVFIADIQDACYQDSLLFILDSNNSIFAFNTNNGKLQKMIRYVGRSNSEYLDAKAITIDQTYLYVLDFQGRKINRYDFQLNFTDYIRIGFPAMDFAKVKDGFLIYNLNANESDKQIVFIGMDGKIKSSFLEPSFEMDYMMTDKIFSEDENGTVFISLPMSNCLYSWEDDSVNVMYNIGFEDESNAKDLKKSSELIEKVKSIVVRSFVTSKYVLTFYSSEDKPYMFINVYDKERKVSESGVATFHPISSFNQWLICVYNITEDQDNSGRLLFRKYRIKR